MHLITFQAALTIIFNTLCRQTLEPVDGRGRATFDYRTTHIRCALYRSTACLRAQMRFLRPIGRSIPLCSPVHRSIRSGVRHLRANELTPVHARTYAYIYDKAIFQVKYSWPPSFLLSLSLSLSTSLSLSLSLTISISLSLPLSLPLLLWFCALCPTSTAMFQLMEMVFGSHLVLSWYDPI